MVEETEGPGPNDLTGVDEEDTTERTAPRDVLLSIVGGEVSLVPSSGVKAPEGGGRAVRAMAACCGGAGGVDEAPDVSVDDEA